MPARPEPKGLIRLDIVVVLLLPVIAPELLLLLLPAACPSSAGRRAGRRRLSGPSRRGVRVVLEIKGLDANDGVHCVEGTEGLG